MKMHSPQPSNKAEWADCMEKVKQQDTEAFAHVFQYFTPRLKQFALKHMGNEQVAMEIVQEALTAVWNKSYLFNSEKSALSTWIFTIARNLCFDTLRKQRGKELHLHSEDLWPEDFCPPEFVESYSPEQDRLKQQVVSYLDRLPDTQRAVVQAVYLDDLPHHQVAEMFDIPLGTVKSRLRLAIEKLRHSIDVESK